jgi:transposase InsO family protein
VEYASRSYTNLLASHEIRASMSRKGDCCDNACSETLFGSLKVERLHGMELKDHREAKDATLDWLLWYNGSRMHSTLRYLSPAQFERQALAPLALAA